MRRTVCAAILIWSTCFAGAKRSRRLSPRICDLGLRNDSETRGPGIVLSFSVQEYTRRSCNEACADFGGSVKFSCRQACDTSAAYCTCDESDLKESLCAKNLGSKLCECSVDEPDPTLGQAGNSAASYRIHIDKPDQRFSQYVAEILQQDPDNAQYLSIRAASIARNAPLPAQRDIALATRGVEAQVSVLDVLALFKSNQYAGQLPTDSFGYKQQSDSDSSKDASRTNEAKPLMPVPMLATDMKNPWYDPAKGKFVLDTPGQCHGSICYEHVGESTVKALEPSRVDFEVLSESPRVFYYPNFLSEQEVRARKQETMVVVDCLAARGKFHYFCADCRFKGTLNWECGTRICHAKNMGREIFGKGERL